MQQAILFAFALLATANGLYAQMAFGAAASSAMNTEKGVSTTTAAGAFGETMNITANNNEVIPGFYHTAKPIAADFSGYMVQIKTSMTQLDKNDQLFAEFGGIRYEEMLNPAYCYFVGQFNTKEAAEKYLQTVIMERYPNAVLVHFENGKRTNK